MRFFGRMLSRPLTMSAIPNLESPPPITGKKNDATTMVSRVIQTVVITHLLMIAFPILEQFSMSLSELMETIMNRKSTGPITAISISMTVDMIGAAIPSRITPFGPSGTNFKTTPAMTPRIRIYIEN